MRIVKKRRRERKTDYKARLSLIKSGLPRIVVRKTNRYVIAQYVESKEAQDKLKTGVTSKQLLKYGWEKKNEGSLKSLPACYLTGLLLGKKIQDKEQEVILDIGLIRNVKKNRIYAVLKGLADAGIKINHKKEVFPEEKRIRGEHLKNKIDFDKIKDNISSLKKNLEKTKK